MSTQLSLTDKLSITVVLVGIFCISLVYYISESYKQFTYHYHVASIQQLASLEIQDILDELQANSLDLALAISKEQRFQRDFREKNRTALRQELDEQFNQYFVTAGVLKLLKLYVLDTRFTLISASGEGIDTGGNSELICPQLSQLAMQRKGPEMLQTLSQRCLYKTRPVFAVIVPFGGLRPRGYIQVITDLSYSLKNLEQSLGMPVQIRLLDGQISYQSDNWALAQDANHLNIELAINDRNKRPVMTLLLQSDMTAFNEEVRQHRNRVMIIAIIAIVLMVLIVIVLLQRSAITPLARIHEVLDRLDSDLFDEETHKRLLFEELLEQILLLTRGRRRFAVLLLDLKHFRSINEKYGKTTGDRLLHEAGQRLTRILRDTDFIAWVGTDSSGQKLLPADTQTRYRASLARLGGDEFGLLLPSAQTEEQAVAVARRIVACFHESFDIDGHSLNIECRIGISLYPLHGDDEKTLMRNADKAMQLARARGEDIAVYEPVLKPPQ
ncbi:MAG TPA: GGDEF domain-containing protein [Gammaproteobacteria bacterium]|nr:GGDEF domain-containing protein [Gammaproteobacteria bacterium]